MSIGDTKSYGNKGNNFPWQLQMLKGLQGIIDTYQSGIGRSAQIFSSTGFGSVPDNTNGFSIANVGAAAGTVDGHTLPAGVTINFDPGVNNTITGLPFNATGTTFLITFIG